jgi:hypothetical protein
MHHPAGSLAADETNFALGMEEESDAGEREEGNGAIPGQRRSDG